MMLHGLDKKKKKLEKLILPKPPIYFSVFSSTSIKSIGINFNESDHKFLLSVYKHPCYVVAWYFN